MNISPISSTSFKGNLLILHGGDTSKARYYQGDKYNKDTKSKLDVRCYRIDAQNDEDTPACKTNEYLTSINPKCIDRITKDEIVVKGKNNRYAYVDIREADFAKVLSALSTACATPDDATVFGYKI